MWPLTYGHLVAKNSRSRMRASNTHERMILNVRLGANSYAICIPCHTQSSLLITTPEENRCGKKTGFLQDQCHVPRSTQLYQIEDLDPTWMSPTSDAFGATNASLATVGFLSTRFINGRCLDTVQQVILPTR